jgi:hypothetical protein
MATRTPLTLLGQREIEAGIVGPLFRTFAREVGEARAREIVAEVIRDLARQSGCAAAERAGGTSIGHLAQAKERWREDDALTIEPIRQDEQVLEFNVTRCRYAEMYRALGLEDLGGLLSCGRDAAMIEGFNPNIELTRTQTIMQGASHCDFRYRLATPDPSSTLGRT